MDIWVYVVAVIQLLSHVCLFATAWTAARQASLSFTTSQSFLQLKPIESVKLTKNRARNSNVSLSGRSSSPLVPPVKQAVMKHLFSE